MIKNTHITKLHQRSFWKKQFESYVLLKMSFLSFSNVILSWFSYLLLFFLWFCFLSSKNSYFPRICPELKNLLSISFLSPCTLSTLSLLTQGFKNCFARDSQILGLGSFLYFCNQMLAPQSNILRLKLTFLE